MMTPSRTEPPAPGSPRRGLAALRAVLTPGWVIIALAVLLFTYFAFTFLAPWQLNKNTEKSEFNHRLAAALEHDPVAAASVLPADGGTVGVDKEWTHVRLQGRYLPESEVLLRNRPVDSAPAFYVLTPFREDSGLVVLVNRGWVPAGPGLAAPEIPPAPAGEQSVTGFVRMSEPDPQRPPVTADGRLQVLGIHLPQIAAAVDQPLAADYVQLDEESAQEPVAAMPLPKLDNGPHLSYGIQWIAFGIMAPLGLLWFLRAEIRERRRERAEQAELGTVRAAAAGGDPTPVAAPEQSPAATPRAGEEAMRAGAASASGDEEARESVDYDRYGGTARHLSFGRRRDEGERF